MNLSDHLNWRYAVKKFSDKKIGEDKVNTILENINLTASSCGIQPYRVIVVNNPELQATLGANSFNGQIAGCSHLFVFAAFDEISPEYVSGYVSMIEQQRDLPTGALRDLESAVLSYFSGLSADAQKAWSARQAYIGLGTALIAAAELQVDSTPMEGFDAELFNEILGLKEKGLNAVVTLALGYRDAANDFLSGAKKVRLPIGEFAMSAN